MRNANVDDEMEALLSSDEFEVSDNDVLSNIDSNDQCDLELSDVEVNNPGGDGAARKICESNMLEFEMPLNQNESITFQAGMVFADVHAFRESLVEYSIREGCNCVRIDRTKEASSRWMADKLIDLIKENPEIKPKEVESKESWGFFFNCLEDMLGGFVDEKPWTFMSDRQKGLVETINESIPNAKNRKCCRHIYANLRLSYPGLIVKKLFWAASKAYSKAGNYIKAYNHKIKGIPDSMFWPSVDVTPSTILPPRIKRLPGRPKKNRKKEPDEQNKIGRKRKSAVTKCGNCGGGGHNKRTCKSGSLQLDDETPLASFVDRRKRPRQA
ncbi:hypothetical protein KSP39_PZI022790 [Platanthera zijinensis]|uniref:MULE transposase domain-containing protein n=1 Tax=Platanthera zijinensis TaxID=2320716 RepID=A0AAP0FUS1_9ASPA